MKSTKSFFNRAILKRDLRAFLIPEVLLLLFLGIQYSMLLINPPAFSPSSFFEGGYDSGEFYRSVYGYSMGTLIMAFPAAYLLYRDLFSFSRCGLLYGLPLRREGWCLTHFASGLLLGLINTGLFALILGYDSFGWAVVFPYWMIFLMKYLLFFGFFSFCAMGAGRLSGMLVLSFSLLLLPFNLQYTFDHLHSASLYGIGLQSSVNLEDALSLQMQYFEASPPEEAFRLLLSKLILKIWLWTGLSALVGIGFLGGAVALLKKRQLERAGSFCVFRGFYPFFQLSFTLLIFQLMPDFYGGNMAVELCLGLALLLTIPAGLMLYFRTVKILNFKTLLVLAAGFLVAFGGTALMKADFGQEVHWLPKPEEVKEIKILLDADNFIMDYDIENEAEQAAIIALHQAILTEFDTAGKARQGEMMRKHQDTAVGHNFSADRVRLNYILNDGTEITRLYPLSQKLAEEEWLPWANGWQRVLHTDSLEKLAQKMEEMEISWRGAQLPSQNETLKRVAEAGKRGPLNLTPDLTLALLQAIQADCDQGLQMADSLSRDADLTLRYTYAYKNGTLTRAVTILPECTHTMAFFEAHPEILPEEEQK